MFTQNRLNFRRSYQYPPIKGALTLRHFFSSAKSTMTKVVIDSKVHYNLPRTRFVGAILLLLQFLSADARKIMVGENKETEIRRSQGKARHYTKSGLFAELNKIYVPSRKNLNWQQLNHLAKSLQGPHLSAVFPMTSFHPRTLWLVTLNEHQTIVFPRTGLGLFGALSGWALTTNQFPEFWVIIARPPSVFF